MMHRIEVRPFGERSWQLSWGEGAGDEPMIFRSGARAETAARALAQRLAASGDSVETLIVLRDGSVAARSQTPAAQARPLRR